MPILDSLLNVPQNAVFAFVNESKKQVYVQCSKDCLLQFARMIRALRDGLHDNKALQEGFNNNELKLVVVKEFPKDYPEVALKAEVRRVIGSYVVNGYENLRPEAKAPRYKLKVKLMSHYKDGRMRPLVYVLAVSRRNDKLLMGLFYTFTEAEEWIKENIPGSSDFIPRFCNNELTQAYHTEFGHKFIH